MSSGFFKVHGNNNAIQKTREVVEGACSGWECSWFTPLRIPLDDAALEVHVAAEMLQKVHSQETVVHLATAAGKDGGLTLYRSWERMLSESAEDEYPFRPDIELSRPPKGSLSK